MSNEDLAEILTKDLYLKERKKPTEAEQQLYLKEVDFHCPLCGADLRNRKQRKSNKLYEIAHIYPNSPTQEQYDVLKSLKRLGDNSETFENKIALCKVCHSTQDYHTSKEEYLCLLKKKETLLQKTALDEATFSLGLEQDIAFVVEKISTFRENDFSQLNYSPVLLTNKFTSDESLLKRRVAMYVTEYYPYIRELFKGIDGKNGFRLTVLSMQISCCFAKMEIITDSKDAIFEQIVEWIYTKTLFVSKPACEAVASFFIQNCEVFHEITK